MKPKKKEDQSVDASVLLRGGIKILTGENMETKCGVETKGKAISIPYTVTSCGCWEVLAEQITDMVVS